MGGGMMNGMMGNMMSQCKKMMGEDSAGQVRLPELPPGNEALQFRMHAEMLQKIGEIAVGYADRVDTGK
ncbi:MAG: hypothetical protein H2060_08695 [Azoarcus sp.]|nr:hypothetical protein [Azoarcus sp.]